MGQRENALNSWILLGIAALWIFLADDQPAYSARPAPNSAVIEQFLNQHCIDCHHHEQATAGVSFDSLNARAIHEDSAIWERVVRMLRARRMPPADMPSPDEASYDAVAVSLETALDQAAALQPNPGRTETFRRLNRNEYQNAIRDLLALEIDITSMLPADQASHGFDNVTVGDLSPTLLNRYISAAQKISRLAMGGIQRSPGGDTFRVRPDVTQEAHVAGLPFGTRGGTVVRYTFPQDGEYEIAIRLARDRDELVEGLTEPHQIELLLDRRPVRQFRVAPPSGKVEADYFARPSHAHVDEHLRARLSVTAGRHQIGVTFVKQPSSLLETTRQPLNVHFNVYRHPRIGPAVFQVSITGPFQPIGPGHTPSRQKVLVCQPKTSADEETCAEQILTTLMRRAYRRPIEPSELRQRMDSYRQGRNRGNFETGIEWALSSVLVNPQFLFRIEQDPPGIAPNTPYRVSDLDLASRLSFFLWSSIPDDKLLRIASQDRLHEPAVLEHQVRRMLADARARALVSNFAGQWLYLRNLESTTPDMRQFPDFDDNLRQAFRRETELLFEAVMREDRSVLDLLSVNFTYLNERLAKHYGIPHVYGSRFRKVTINDAHHRGGLLRHGSVLTVTSYATRTSPVLRGKWILENLLGTPPPPPPADVPALNDKTILSSRSVRERLAEHRANAACATCHDLIDPIGFALENFNAVGRWRQFEDGQRIDAAGGLPGGKRFTGVRGLEQGLLDRPEIFVGTMAEKLLTYALGRGVEPFDATAIRKIVRSARTDDYRFSSIILGVVNSTPFQMRTSE